MPLESHSAGKNVFKTGMAEPLPFLQEKSYSKENGYHISPVKDKSKDIPVHIKAHGEV
jgi:hypothetical protein